MKKFILALVLVIFSVSCQKEYYYYGTPEEKEQTAEKVPGIFSAIVGDWVPGRLNMTVDGETMNGDFQALAKENDAKVDAYVSVGENDLTLKMKVVYPDNHSYDAEGVAYIKFIPTKDGKSFKVEFLVEEDGETDAKGNITFNRK